MLTNHLQAARLLIAAKQVGLRSYRIPQNPLEAYILRDGSVRTVSPCHLLRSATPLRHQSVAATAGTTATAAMVAAPDSTPPGWAVEAASEVLKTQKGLGSKGPLRDAVAARLAAKDAGQPAQADLEAKVSEGEALLKAFTSRRFGAAALEHMAAAEPGVLTEVDDPSEVLDILAKACFLPNRVVTLIEATPRILTDIPAEDLRDRIAHMKRATSPMGSQLAAMWEKDPQTLWLKPEQIDERLAWLEGLGVPRDRVRFVYARLPAVFTAELETFQPQLDYLEGIGVNVGDMLTKRPHYLQKSVEQLRKSKPRLLADFKQRGGAKLAAVAAEESE